MRILVLGIHAPFLQGGAEAHVSNLAQALSRSGHDVDILRLPFQFFPEVEVARTMRFVEGYDLRRPNAWPVDRVISLQFPLWGMEHPHHVVWVMHQLRSVYDLYDRQTASPELQDLRQQVMDFDTQALSRVKKVFANSGRVADRLWQHNRVSSTPLYHPPPLAERYMDLAQDHYVYYPARFETLKRQDLLIEAAALWKSPVGLILAGVGGQLGRCERLIETLGVRDRVRLVGQVSRAEEKLAYMGRSLIVANVPQDEDYGYVTLEAMLAGKPVLTTTDAGGPLEFVRHEENGWVVPPTAEAIANAVDQAYAARSRIRYLGAAGREAILARGLTSWEPVVQSLLGV